MKINRLVIENFKSVKKIELEKPNPFTVFVGPNGSGKSTIFEALEFINLISRYDGAASLFGGIDNLRRRQNELAEFKFECDFIEFRINRAKFQGETITRFNKGYISKTTRDSLGRVTYNHQDYLQFFNYSRIFSGNEKIEKLPLNDNQKLSLSAKNLEKVLKRILSDTALRNEIFEWLELFVPEFKSVEVVANPFNGEEMLLWYEQFSEKPFTKDLISDGTYNILALLTAVYQSDDKPQFLCIEEPENGLNPKVVKELVNLCRSTCEEYGHYIWLNTHSQTLVSQLTPNEIVLVDKKEGATQTKQIKDVNLHGLPMDEAWLSNALGGGLPW